MELSSFNNSFKTATRTRFQTITFVELHALLNTEVSFLEKKSNSKESIVISSFAIVENFDNPTNNANEDIIAEVVIMVETDNH